MKLSTVVVHKDDISRKNSERVRTKIIADFPTPYLMSRPRSHVPDIVLPRKTDVDYIVTLGTGSVNTISSIEYSDAKERTPRLHAVFVYTHRQAFGPFFQVLVGLRTIKMGCMFCEHF